MSKQEKSHGITRIGIVGAGMIGASLAALFTGHGYRTTLLSPTEATAARGRELFHTYFEDLAKVGLVTPGQGEICARYLHFTDDYAELADSDFIIECIIENLAEKQQVYAELARHCTRAQAVTSTSSAMAADTLAAGADERIQKLLVVAHPFNPPHLVPFVECLPASTATQEALRATVETFESVGRQVAVMNKPAPGFIANRLQHALVREAIHMVEEGITDADGVNKALTFSFAPRYTQVGLLEHMDYAGLDMIESIHETLYPDLCNADSPQALVTEAVARGDLGAKTGRGIHDWATVDMDEFREAESRPYYQFFDWALPNE